MEVEDDSTKVLMVEYYQLLKNKKKMGRREALRTVQMNMLNGKFNNVDEDRNYSTPYHWAALETFTGLTCRVISASSTGH